MSIFKDCDIRGIYGKELKEDAVYRIGRALATISGSGRFYVGGDVRVSTPQLKAALIRGLLESGAHVLDMGIIATPMLYFALSRGGAENGATVTASHNPKQYNGVKFMLGGTPVTAGTISRVEQAVLQADFCSGEGTLERVDMKTPYLAFLLDRFAGVLKGLKVVVDAGNGAMSEIAPAAFRQAGAEVVELYCEADGSFPNRTPNPAEYDKLTALSEAVRRARADYGVAFDGDGDRAVFADDNGEIVISERSFALFVRYLLRNGASPVVYDQKSSSVVKDAILSAGGEPVMERSGHMFIKKRFLELGARLAGEVSGHFFFGELGYDDGLYAALMLGKMLRDYGKKLSELLSDIVPRPITPDLRFPVPYGEMDGVLARMRGIALDGETVSEMDGVRIEGKDGWMLVRKSVTAEQMTLRIEAKDVSELVQFAKRAMKVLPASAEECLARELPG